MKVEPLRTAERRTRTIGRRVRDEARLDQPLGESGERHLSLHSRKLRAEAKMDAAAEAEMMWIGAIRVKAIRIAKSFRVAIARRK